jgi:GT2 family glycosyltransferase/glycosyltransferase involved in cell wall biosynthesis
VPRNGHLAAATDVVVCVRDALADVRHCLASVVARGDEAPLRLIVVDDGSGRDTEIYLRRFATSHPGCELVRFEEPVGYTCAANAGLRTTTARQVVLLNSDTIVTPGWLAGLRECLRSSPEIGLAGPLANAASYQSIPAIRSPSGDWSLNPLPTAWGVDQVAALLRATSERAFPRVAFLNGFCLMIARDVIEAIGYLDEASFPLGFGEENDYCLRARDAGFALAVADHVYVFHAKSRSFTHARRKALSARGRQALREKHGEARIDADSAGLAADDRLAGLRAAMGEALRGSSPPPVTTNEPLSVLFLLPVSGGGGGAHSIVQEAMGMRGLGVESRIAIRAKHAALYARNYPNASGMGIFLPFASEDELVARAGAFDAIVATIYTSMPLLAAVAAAHPGVLPAYYVQDYEPWFHREGTRERAAAEASYTAVEGMTVFAKTDWLRRMVERRHGIAVAKVEPSLDHDVYYPALDGRDPDAPIRIAAMIRPSTPRRGALRTMETLETLARRFRHSVAFDIFGCDDEELAKYGLTPDFPLTNHGKLRREEVAELLRRADIFLDLSDYQAFGRTGLEAMACGCAVVLPAHGGVEEYAVHGENALVINTADATACLAAAAELIRNGELRRRLRRGGIATAERYSVFQAALSEVALIREALQTTATRRVLQAVT